MFCILTFKLIPRGQRWSKVKSVCIFTKLSIRPFQRYPTWHSYVLKNIGTWPWTLKGPSDFVKKQTWTYLRPLVSNTENRIQKYWRVNEICATRQTDGQSIVVIPIKGFQPLIMIHIYFHIWPVHYELLSTTYTDTRINHFSIHLPATKYTRKSKTLDSI
jgi:hypothetical protein